MACGLLLNSLIGLQLAAAALGAAAAATDASGATGTTVAFEGSALLITYYSGVAQALMSRGVIVPGSTHISGLSGGAWTAVVTTLGYGGSQQRDFWKGLVAECGQRWGSCAGHVNTVMQEKLDRHLPEDVAASLNGRVSVALSQLDASKTHLNGSASWIISDWQDKEDVISCLKSTDYIPCFTGGTTYHTFRGHPVIDGGYANGFDQLCASGNLGAGCIKVSSWHVGDKADHACNPAVCGEAASLSNCASAARTAIRMELHENGPRSEGWNLAAVEQRCPPEDWQGLAPYPLPDWVPHNATTPDIHPGKYGSLPQFRGREILACQWQGWSMQLPRGHELEAMDVVYQQGLKDALAWCQENGHTGTCSGGEEQTCAS